MAVALYSVYERMVRGDSPNAWWRFKSGAELTETIVGAALVLTKTGTIAEVSSLLSDAVSASEKARDFDGSTGRYTAPDHANIDLGDVFTIEAWIRPDSFASTMYILTKQSGAYALKVDTSGRVVLREHGIGDMLSSDPFTMTAGTVYHVAATKNGAMVRIYINGVERNVASVGNVCTNNAASLIIGAETTTPTNLFNGTIGEVALYPVELSPARIMQHYLAGSAAFVQVADQPSYFPKVCAMVAFESGPKVEWPKWAILSDRVRDWGLSRGKSQWDSSQIDTGTYECSFSNHDRSLEAEYDGSPYWPNVKKTRQIMHAACWTGVQYDLFRGNISDWGPEWPHMGVDSVANVKAHDAQKLANLEDLTGALSQQVTGARINTGLDTLGIAAGMRLIDTGVPSVVAEANTEGLNLLAHLQDTSKADPGLLFIDGSGRWAFQDRNHRQESEEISRATFGDAPGEIGYRAVRAKDDDADLWNDIRITVAGTGNVRTATDSTSITDHGKRTKSESLKLVTDAQGDGVAGAWLVMFKDGRRRIPEIEVEGASDPALCWPVLLGAEISWHVTTLRRPLDETGEPVGSPILIEQHIEGIKMNAGRGVWKTNLNLAPADTQPYWELGTAGKSELGETTWLYI